MTMEQLAKTIVVRAGPSTSFSQLAGVTIIQNCDSQSMFSDKFTSLGDKAVYSKKNE
jgi:hypothetical protein